MTSEFRELLESIRERPALYIEAPSITCLGSFLDGYFFRAAEARKTELGGFPNWVALRLDYFEGTMGWVRMLRQYYDGDDEAAFERFFVLIDEFTKREARVIYEASLRSHPKYEIAQIVKYSDDAGVFVRWVDKGGEASTDELYCGNLESMFILAGGFTPAIERNDWRKKE